MYGYFARLGPSITSVVPELAIVCGTFDIPEQHQADPHTSGI
jgi:hypothetical protein